MRYLSLDVGKRRTGIAFLDEETGIPLPLETFHHTSVQQLISHVFALRSERKIDTIVLGLPLLPSGVEGEQAGFVRSVEELLKERGMNVEVFDERYTTRQSSLPQEEAKKIAKHIDGDAAAACAILSAFLSY